MPEKEPIVPVRTLVSLWVTYLKPHRGRVLLLALLALATLAVRLISPQLVGRFLEGVEQAVALEQLLALALFFVAIAFVEQLFAIVTTYLSEDVAWKATNQLRKELALHCMRLDRSFHQHHSPGTLVERLDGDITTLSHFFSQLAFDLLNNFLLLIGVLVMLSLAEWRVGLLVALTAAVTLFLLDRIRQRAEPRWAEVLQANAALYGYLEERFKGTEDIRSSGATDYILHGLYRLQRVRMQKEYAAVPWLLANLSTPTLALALATLTVFLSGTQLRAGLGWSIGDVYVLYYYVTLLSNPIWKLVVQVESIQKAGASISRILALQATTSLIEAGMQSPLKEKPLQIAFEEVSFRYSEEETAVLSHLSLALEPGEVLCVLGRTGSGKSTLSRLLVRQIDASSGRVCVGHAGEPLVDIRQLERAHLHHHVGVVTQEVELFRASLRDNLTFFNPAIPDSQLLTAIEGCGLGPWLTRFPAGLDTLLGSGGEGLSEGEAQLVAFLRVFLRNPGLVILDEPSARLDPVMDSLVSRAIRRLLQGRTGILIAHRLKTVELADKVLILERGEIVEYGPRAQLLDDRGSRLAAYLQMEVPA